MEIIEVTTKDQLDKLYKGSALTFEGVIPSEAPKYRDYFKNLTNIDESKPCYHIKGKVMNEVYGLTGSKAYNDELNIICFPLDTFENVGKIIIARFQIRGRWFDDVVDNNAR